MRYAPSADIYSSGFDWLRITVAIALCRVNLVTERTRSIKRTRRGEVSAGLQCLHNGKTNRAKVVTTPNELRLWSVFKVFDVKARLDCDYYIASHRAISL